MFKSKADKLSLIFASLSGVTFFAAIGSALWLQVYGMYISLALIFFGGFFMLMSAMVMEKSKASMYAKLKRSQQEKEEEEAIL